MLAAPRFSPFPSGKLRQVRLIIRFIQTFRPHWHSFHFAKLSEKECLVYLSVFGMETKHWTVGAGRVVSRPRVTRSRGRTLRCHP